MLLVVVMLISIIHFHMEQNWQVDRGYYCIIKYSIQIKYVYAGQAFKDIFIVDTILNFYNNEPSLDITFVLGEN